MPQSLAYHAVEKKINLQSISKDFNFYFKMNYTEVTFKEVNDNFDKQLILFKMKHLNCIIELLYKYLALLFK